METKPLIALAIAALFMEGALQAASPENPLVSAALPLAGSVEGTYLFLQSEDATPPAVYQVYRKAGDDASTNAYQLVGQMRPQTDPRTINALLLRGERLFEDDLSALEFTLDSFLQAMVDDPSVSEITLPEKLATLIDVAATDPEIRDNLRLLAKRFKGVGLCMGTAYAESISGEYTYELRQADFPDQDPSEARLVVSRLTVDTTAPAPLLSAPSKLAAIPMTDPRGHAVVRLRWASPDALRQRGPVHYGYQVYRDGQPVNDQPILPQEELSETEASISPITTAIQTRFGIPSGWQSSVSASNLLADPAYAFPASEADRNAERTLRIARQQSLEQLQNVFHFIDDGALARGDGTGLIPGTSHTYTVAALDVLGRSGAQSSSITVTVPGLEPPQAPVNVAVANAYSYDATSKSGTQELKVRWPALRDETGTVRNDVSYLVYRWNSPTEYLRYRDYPWGHGSTELDPAYAGRPLPPIGLVAAPVDLPTAVDGFIEWTDPTIDINYQSLQVHYTVRAVVDSGNGFPAMSGHSAPAMGVLRDREGPGSATILGLRLPCPLIALTCVDEANIPLSVINGPNNSSIVEVEVNLTNLAELPFFDAASFAYKTAAAPRVDLGTVVFDAAGTASRRFSLPGKELPSSIQIFCRVRLSNGFWSEESACFLTPPKGSARAKKRFAADFLGYDRASYNQCGSVFYPYEVDGTEIDPAFGVTPAADTYAYSFYRRVDNGRLELIRNVEVPDALDPATALSLIDEAPPNFFKRLCYYYQGRDQHGNPGPLQRLECLSFGGPQAAMPQPQVTRVYRTENATEDDPGLTLEFFCPPAGVESFLIEVRNPNADIPLSLTAYDADYPDLVSSVLTRAYPEGHRYAGYASVAITLLDQEAGLFSIDFGGIEADVDYVFRVIARGPLFGDVNAPAGAGPGIAAIEGAPSEEITGNWRSLGPRDESTVPMVRWPARANTVPVDLAGTPSLNATGPIAVEFVDRVYAAGPPVRGWKGVGIEVGSFLVTDEKNVETSVTFPKIDGKDQNQWPQVTTILQLQNPADLADNLYEVTIPGPLPDSSSITRSLLPCVLYRMMVDADGNPVSGDLVQCSPLIGNDVTLAVEVPSTSIRMRDPFLLLGSGVPESGSLRIPLYIKDNQPVIRGETYRYYLALTDARGEVATILDLGALTIPTLP